MHGAFNPKQRNNNKRMIKIFKVLIGERTSTLDIKVKRKKKGSLHMKRLIPLGRTYGKAYVT